MKLLSYFIGNFAGLLAAAKFVDGFQIDSDLARVAAVAALLTLGNIVIRPILRFILAPLVWITLGLFTLVINAAILAAVDFISDFITINGLTALLYGTLIISVAVWVAGWGLKLFSEEQAPVAQ